MKVLFVSSGNHGEISSIILNQANSITEINPEIEIEHFLIKGKGLIGYLRNVLILRKFLNKNSFDLIHAHYSLSGYVASLAGAKCIIVSLMGSDVKSLWYLKYILNFFTKISWKDVIVKSKDMKDSCKIQKAHVIANGVNLHKFRPIDKAEAFKITKWNTDKKHVLFGSDPDRKEKNYKLTKEAFDLLADQNTELHSLIHIPNELIPYYLNAADVVILTSFWEGSPNIVKEAMACNRPVLCTNVGDIIMLIDNIPGCMVTSFEPKEIAEKLKMILAIDQPIKGRERITELELDSDSVARNIISLYIKALASK